jgi:hypothetical protein
MKKGFMLAVSLLGFCSAGIFIAYNSALGSSATATVRILLYVSKPAVYFIAPENNTVISNPINIKFGVRNFGVAPADVLHKNTGHHHLIVDAPLPDLTKPIPFDDHHIHFSGGETETNVELPPGKHTLQLLLGDFSHTPHSQPLFSDPITITVQ